MGVSASRILVVGDYVFDIEAGYQAGAVTAFLTNGGRSCSFLHPPDFTLAHLAELKEPAIPFAAAGNEDGLESYPNHA